MTVRIDLGVDGSGGPASLDLEELLATRLLVQGNSGSGKSHLLRRILEGSAGLVQQIVIDPEGDFVSLSDAFGHVSIEAAEYSLVEIGTVAARLREHRASVVLNLEGLEVEGQMRCAATFLAALFDAPREHWYPALVVVDEAQVFAPAVAGEVSDEARRTSLGAMTNLMCRGRKRGLAGVIATQRLAKLAKNVAAEASNFLMGRTFLDIDMARAADLLGMDRKQAETIRDLSRGEFLALGPAITRRPLSIRIGDVQTSARSASPRLVPLPTSSACDIEDLLFSRGEHSTPLPSPPPAVPADELLKTIASPVLAKVPDAPLLEPEQQAALLTTIIEEIAAEGLSRPQAAVFQDFQSRCRMRGITLAVDLQTFSRRLATVLAGLEVDGQWANLFELAAGLPEEMLAPFLLLGKAASTGADCPSDAQLAALYRTASSGRVRRMLEFIEQKGLIVCRDDLSGRRSVNFPHLGWTTAAAHPDPTRPPRMARIMARESRATAS